MKMQKCLLLIGVFFLVVLSIDAQKISFIGFFNTTGKNIQKGMISKERIVLNEIQTIARSLETYGYDFDGHAIYDGLNCTKSNVMKAIDELQVVPEDIVIFYYSGHGGRALNDDDPFPQMCLTEGPSNYIPATLVRNMILRKKPRLTVVLTGCCNSEGSEISIKSVYVQGQNYTVQKEKNHKYYKKLFIDNTGWVQMTSSRAKEYSYTGDGGSFFCHVFWTVMNGVGEGMIDADWNILCKNVQEYVSSIAIHAENGIAYQHPDYRVNTSCEGVSNIKKDKKNGDTNSSISDAINSLLDKSKSIDSRLNMIPSIMSNHFSSVQLVRTLARNMTTVVDHEDPNTFLMRITMSPYIEQVNIVEQNGSIMSVHEIRSQ